MTTLTHRDRLRLRGLISSYSGLGESLQGDNALERAVAQRLQAHGLDSLAEYWALIERQPDGEMNSLVQVLTNKETFFFREMHQFEVLRERVLPELLAARRLHDSWDAETGSRHPLRMWSAGCSTGEEPYSLAITLHQFEQEHGPLHAEIIGTDIDASALEFARRGCYGERALRLVPADWRTRYFAFDGQCYQLVPEVARRVHFRVYNLAGEQRPSALSNLDVIFCRNVTIYFNAEARDQLNAQLTDALREGGYLFVASAETMGHNQGRLELLSMGKTFLFRKGQSTRQQAIGAVPGPPPIQPLAARTNAGPPRLRPQSPPPAADPTPSVPIPAPQVTMPTLARAQAAFQRQDYAGALRELNRQRSDQPLELEAHSLRAAILVQTGQLEDAETASQLVLAHDPWNTDAHFLMGVIFYHQGQHQQAIQALKSVVYLQPEHRTAHFYLAEAYRALGLVEQAQREYKNTLNILRVAHRPAGSVGMNLSGLEDDMLLQACETNLAHLQQPTRLKSSGGNRA